MDFHGGFIFFLLIKIVLCFNLYSGLLNLATNTSQSTLEKEFGPGILSNVSCSVNPNYNFKCSHFSDGINYNYTFVLFSYTICCCVVKRIMAKLFFD